ncbi:MAG: AMP-binding protein [Acetobacteraceae bacterium]|nr:AMP-binding protein [Acetobacteraceae bacterium]MBV8574891.1 AMP-binding protein [Acetobacteraceae bacterium]
MTSASNLFDRFVAAGRKGTVLSDGSGRALDWAHILILIEGLQRAFTAAGLRKGDRLAISANKSIDSFLVYLAALRSGLGYVPINVSYSGREIGDIVAAARPAGVIFEGAEARGRAGGRQLPGADDRRVVERAH